ncbi:uncharacterized protein IWZ02DRAFT_70894 [Phyllosticta citriasiana]|uniref:Uncharacterized protein n=1 Tax=Phyllosticta citriasiana TaxID=595635 RepID=A0ABR1KTE0_9PEZI
MAEPYEHMVEPYEQMAEPYEQMAELPSESEYEESDYEHLRNQIYDLSDQIENLEDQIKALRKITKDVKAIRSRCDTSNLKPDPLEPKFPVRRELYEDWTEVLVTTISDHCGWFTNEDRKLDYLIESSDGWMHLLLRDRYGYRARKNAARNNRPLKFKHALADLDMIFLPPKDRSHDKTHRQWMRLELLPGFSFSEFLPKFLFLSNRLGVLERQYRSVALYRCLPRAWRHRREIRRFGKKACRHRTLRNLVDRLFDLEAEEKGDDRIAQTYIDGPEEGQDPPVYDQDDNPFGSPSMSDDGVWLQN